jgi:hypothetical protein
LLLPLTLPSATTIDKYLIIRRIIKWWENYVKIEMESNKSWTQKVLLNKGLTDVDSSHILSRFILLLIFTIDFYTSCLIHPGMFICIVQCKINNNNNNDMGGSYRHCPRTHTFVLGWFQTLSTMLRSCIWKVDGIR